jgi:hypothetical protein
MLRSATAAQRVIDLTLLTVVAIGEIGPLCLKGAITPFLAWVLEDIPEDASSWLIIKLTANLTAAFSSITTLLLLRVTLDDAFEVCSEEVIDDIAYTVCLQKKMSDF